MTPRSSRVSAQRSKFSDYLNVGDNFYKGAEAARTFEYWNAAGLLIVHAAIAYADALTIKVGGVRSRSDDHMYAVELIQEVVILDTKGKSALTHLIRMIEQKNVVSYDGEIFREKDVDELWKHLERFRTWALELLQH